MPTNCVTEGSCGTHAALWLNGNHPTESDGIVTRNVCGSWAGSCCAYRLKIQVRQCPGSFYIYKFGQLPGCHLAFCSTGKKSKL